MTSSDNKIRNFSIIAHIDAGKSTTSDFFLLMGGHIKEDDAGEKRGTDTRKDEKERGITIKSTGVSLPISYDSETYMINLLDTPGHSSFNHNVTASLRLTDGALVLVDAVEGVCVQTETVLKQALAELVRPILVINKMDRYFFELKLDADTAYNNIINIVNKVNVLINTYQDNKDGYEISPENGNVFFISAYHGWGFGIHTWARMYGEVMKKKPDDLMKKLWGENYYHTEKKKLVKESIKGKTIRSFCHLIYKPLFDLANMIVDYNEKEFDPALEKKLGNLKIKLSGEERSKRGKELYKIIFKKFLSLQDALMYGVVNKLPSPIEAQKIRAGILYTGPKEDEVYKSIANCDPTGPLVIYVASKVPTEEGAGRFYSVGRIFSGTLKSGQKVTILNEGYNHDSKSKADIFEDKAVQRIVKMIAAKPVQVDSAQAGEIVALVGIDKFFLKSCTVTTAENPYPIKTMTFRVHPVVQVSVSVKNPSNIGKLTEGLKKLTQSDQAVQCYTSESGENIVAGVEELHLEVCIHDLRQFMGDVEIIISEPVVPLRETVTTRSDRICLTKSPNNHNRLYVTAEPLDEKLVNDIEAGKINLKDPKLYRKLADEYGWDVNEAKKIWAFGNVHPTNVLVDMTKGLQYLQEAKGSIIAQFEKSLESGILCEEPLRGVRFNIVDVVLHADAIHRGAAQLFPAMRRVMYSSVLTATPRLIEPYYLIEIQIPDSKVGIIYSSLAHRRGRVIGEEPIVGTPVVTILGHLPVVSSFGFDDYLKKQTSGQAFSRLSFDHWEVIDVDPFNEKSLAGQLVEKVRKKKNIKLTIPPLSDYLDKI